MTPFSFEWQWNIEYLIFFGLLYLALTIVGCGMIYAFIKSWFEIMKDNKNEKIQSIVDQKIQYPDY